MRDTLSYGVLHRSAEEVCEDLVWTRWIEIDLVPSSLCRKLAITLWAFKTVFYMIVLDDGKQVTDRA